MSNFLQSNMFINRKGQMFKWMCLLMFSIVSLQCVNAKAAPPVNQLKVGFNGNLAYNATYQRHNPFHLFIQKQGMVSGLFSAGLLETTNAKPGELYDAIRPFNCIVISSEPYSFPVLTPQIEKSAEIVGKDLVRYAKEGGGIFFILSSQRQIGFGNEAYYNIILQQFGVKMLKEGIFDSSTAFQSVSSFAIAPSTYFTTNNIKNSPVTKGIRSLAFPKYFNNESPGVATLQLDGNWNTVVAGQATAKSYALSDYQMTDKIVAHNAELPIAATRAIGKGRVLVYSLAARDAFINFELDQWPQTTESAGNIARGIPSDGIKFILNGIRWTGEASKDDSSFGTYEPPVIKPITFQKSVNWDAVQGIPPYPQPEVYGTVGAHSSYTDGKGTVAQYAQAAKAAGLSYIVFTDPLEQLTEEEFEKLKADCEAASHDGFYASPGMEFTDSTGIRWAMWGNTVVWPKATIENLGKTYVQWDGKIIHNFGIFAERCGYAQNAIVDYKPLHEANIHPSNMWWYFDVFPFSYDLTDGTAREIADNVQEYLYALRDIRWISTQAFTRMTSPQQVALAAKTCVTSVRNIMFVPNVLNATTGATDLSTGVTQYVTQGPRILQWGAENVQMDHPAQGFGSERVPSRFAVSSDVGIKEVIVHDANYGVVRRYAGHGAKELARQFEMKHDKQHYLLLEVVDTNGKRAISNFLFLKSYKYGLYRCGDNLNFLCGAMLLWHPDRNQVPDMAQLFLNGWKNSLQGFDTGIGLTIKPNFWPTDYIMTSDGKYPNGHDIVTNNVLDVKIASHQMQVYSTKMAYEYEGYLTDTRPEPAWGPFSRRIAPLKYFEREQTTYVPQNRTNMFVFWDHRRPFEAMENYGGNILLTEGSIRFTKDVTLKGAVPVPFLQTIGPGGGAAQHMYDRFYVTDKKAGLITKVNPPDQKKQWELSGEIAPGGYCASMNTPTGYYAFFAGSNSNFTYSISPNGDPSGVGMTTIGMGHDGQQVKAGTVWHYRFAIATLPNQGNVKDNTLIKAIDRSMNFDGKDAGYPYKMQTGEFVDAEYFFTAKAKDNEAQFSIGPRKQIIDLPIRVQGLEDNGSAAVYVKGSDRFVFIPVSNGTAYFQEPVDKGTQMWVGNPFICENKDVKFALLIDGQTAGQAPLLEGIILPQRRYPFAFLHQRTRHSSAA